MKISNFNWLFLSALFTFTACVETEIVPEVLIPKLTLQPESVSLIVNQTTNLNATFTDEKGIDRSGELQWRSTNPTVASIATGGVVTALTPGQGWIIVSARNSLTDSTLVTVASNPNQVAKVAISAPQNTLLVGTTLPFTATIQNTNNQNLQGKTIIWDSSNPVVLSINATGVATANALGTAQVTARVDGIASLPFQVEVTAAASSAQRKGTFQGNHSYSVKGTATLQEQGDKLKLVFGTDFVSSNGPQLGVYLAKSAPGVLTAQNSVRLGLLKKNAGTQEYEVPANVKLSDYDYAVVYCEPFNVAFGFALLK